MKKKLDIGNITNELAGASLFFTKSPAPPAIDEVKAADSIPPEVNAHRESPDQPSPVKKKRNTDKSSRLVKPKLVDENIMIASKHASNNASMQANNDANIQAFNHDIIIETIRKAVKDVGKESATYRFTPEEKKALLELSFSYKMQGYKTSENELTRIAINFLLEDQKQNGQNSVLQRVLDALKK